MARLGKIHKSSTMIVSNAHGREPSPLSMPRSGLSVGATAVGRSAGSGRRPGLRFLRVKMRRYVQKRRNSRGRIKIDTEERDQPANRLQQAEERTRVWRETKVEGDPWAYRLPPEKRK
jgi:hypothetical protein